MRILSGIQFTTHFIEFVVVQTKQFVGSTVNMNLTRQTCGQRPSRAAPGKRRVLAFLCTTSELGLAKRMQLRIGDLRQILLPNIFFNLKSALRSRILFASPEVVHRPRSGPLKKLLHFDSNNIYQSSSRKIKCKRLAFAFRSPARALAASLPRQDHVYITSNELFRFHNNERDEMPCRLDSTENPHLSDKYPTPP